MAHFRKQIRDSIQARLQAVLLDAATVYSGRLTPLRDSECPAVNVLAFGDDLDDERSNVSRQLRTSPIVIQILVSGRRDATQDDADALAEMVEQALVLSPTWAPPVRSLTYASTAVDMEPGADGVLVSTTLNYFAGVAMPAGKPGEPLIAAQPRS